MRFVYLTSVQLFLNLSFGIWKERKFIFDLDCNLLGQDDNLEKRSSFSRQKCNFISGLTTCALWKKKSQQEEENSHMERAEKGSKKLFCTKMIIDTIKCLLASGKLYITCRYFSTPVNIIRSLIVMSLSLTF